MRHPKVGTKDFLTPPLLVMNNMISLKTTDDLTTPISKQLESLTSSVFQSLFPPIYPQNTSLQIIRRVLILDRELSATPNLGPSPESASYRINLRHYAITTNNTGLSRGIRRLDAVKKLMQNRANTKTLLNLGNLDDVAEYLLDPSTLGVEYTSGSESEIETDAEVEVLDTKTRKAVKCRQFEPSANRDDEEFRRGSPNIERRAVKLVELGPRLRLRMTKVEDGICAGRIMWHEYVSKSKEEVDEMENIWEERRHDKEKRKEAQKEVLERKKRPQKVFANEIIQDLDMDDEEEWASDGYEVTSIRA